MSIKDQELDPLAAVGEGKNYTSYDAEKTKTHRNAINALCVVRQVRQRLLHLVIMVFGNDSRRSGKLYFSLALFFLLLLKLLYEKHDYGHLSMKLGWGARVVLDYSKVQNINGLESLRKRLDSLCFVSVVLLLRKIFVTVQYLYLLLLKSINSLAWNMHATALIH
jgi:hypothetical protein